MTVANALNIINEMFDTLRMMFTTASGCSPRCSTARKKPNQIPTAMKSWSIVQTEVSMISRSSFQSKRPNTFSAYFSTSTRRRV